MPSLLFWILGSTFLVCLISLIGIATLVLKDMLLQKILLTLVGFSAGALIGGAFLHLLPEALEHSVSINVFSYLIVGFSIFFLLERFLYWRHCHKGKCDVHIFTYLNLIGDGIHNFIDGLVIAASFIINIPIGIVTTLAVVSHEVPQELGDFGVLVYGGFSKFKALFYNFLSALTAIFGAFTGYFFFPLTENFDAFILSFAAGGFIYIASSDLIPELHREANLGRASSSFVFFVAGILLMAIVKLVFQH